MNYQNALEKLGKRDSRKIDNNTYLQKRGEDKIAIKLHATDIVVFSPDATVLNSGGWQTVTTKDRMNKFVPGRVFSDRGIWYYSASGKWNPQESVAFADGLTIHSDGSVTGQGKDPKKTQKLRTRCTRYAQKYVDALFAGKVPAPSNGDCFSCLLRDEENGTPMGELFHDKDHIESHIAENYFVPSLLVNAFAMFGAAPVMRWAVAEMWNTDQLNGKDPHFSKQDYIINAIRKTIKRYVMRQLGLAA